MENLFFWQRFDNHVGKDMKKIRGKDISMIFRTL